MIERFVGQERRPYLILATVIALFVLVGGTHEDVLTVVTAYSVVQTFSTVALVALGLGLTMLVGEFDLSVAGVFGLAGCVAVLTGGDHAWLGIVCALATGAAFGLLQGLVIAGLRLGSVPVTLGGLLVSSGLAYVVTQNQTLTYDNLDLSLALNDPIAGIFSIRSLVTLAIFAAAFLVFNGTRIGRDLIATGSDRRASITAGVAVRTLIVASFIWSGALAALSGALLSYGLASASPAALSDVLVPATAAAILGGISLSGGVGGPLGIAAGVLTLAVLRSGLNALGAPPVAHDIVTGLILLAVAIVDAPYLVRWLNQHGVLLAWNRGKAD